MSKTLMFFFLILLLLNLRSYSVVDDSCLIHNGVKYYEIDDFSGFYNFIGSKHKVGTLASLVAGFPDLYCLDTDTEENIIFVDRRGKDYIWVKEGFAFPNGDTLIDKLYYTMYDVEDIYKKDIEIAHCSFNSLFIEVEDPNIEELCYFGDINILYYVNIEYSTYIYCDEFYNFYINVFSYDNKKDYYFKIVDESLISALQFETNK